MCVVVVYAVLATLAVTSAIVTVGITTYHNVLLVVTYRVTTVTHKHTICAVSVFIDNEFVSVIYRATAICTLSSAIVILHVSHPLSLYTRSIA